MMMKYCSLVVLMGAFSATSSAENCSDISPFAPVRGGIYAFCDSQLDAYFGYDKKNKQPSWVVYKVAKSELKTFVVNQGVYSPVKGLSEHLQVDISAFNGTDLDKAYLVAPYQLAKNERSIKNAFSMSNIIPIKSDIWRGELKQLLFKLDMLERDIFSQKGSVVAIYGAVGGSEMHQPEYLYRIYYQELYDLTISYLIPVKSGLGTNVSDYITSIQCIEEKAGISMLDVLNEPIQSDIKNRRATSTTVWARRDGNEEKITCE